MQRDDFFFYQKLDFLGKGVVKGWRVERYNGLMKDIIVHFYLVYCPMNQFIKGSGQGKERSRPIIKDTCKI